jgi:hypothetical protein
MSTPTISMFLSAESQKMFALAQPDEFHYQICYLPASDPMLCKANKTVGVLLQGKYFMHHVVLILTHNSDWQDSSSSVSAFADTITVCDGMPVPCTSQCSIVQSSTEADMTFVMGIIPHPFNYIGLVINSKSDGLVKSESTVSTDLLHQIASMIEPRKKVLDPVYVKDRGQLTPQATHDVAYKWIKYHGSNIAKVDFIQKDGSAGKKRRLMVKNDKDDFVQVRTLSECLNYIQQKTGRDFRKDMLENGDVYGLE